MPGAGTVPIYVLPFSSFGNQVRFLKMHLNFFSLSWCFTAYHATLKRGALDKASTYLPLPSGRYLHTLLKGTVQRQLTGVENGINR